MGLWESLRCRPIREGSRAPVRALGETLVLLVLCCVGIPPQGGGKSVLNDGSGGMLCCTYSPAYEDDEAKGTTMIRYEDTDSTVPLSLTFMVRLARTLPRASFAVRKPRTRLNPYPLS